MERLDQDLFNDQSLDVQNETEDGCAVYTCSPALTCCPWTNDLLCTGDIIIIVQEESPV